MCAAPEQDEPLLSGGAGRGDQEGWFANALMESMPGILYLYRRQGPLLRWNRNFESVSGYSAAEIGSMSPLDFFAAADRERVAARIGEVFETGASSVEADFVAKDGRAVPYFFTGKRILFDGTTCLVGMGLDITDRKSAEAALDKSEARHRATLDSILEACQIIAFDWRYLYLNDAAAKHNRRPNDELLGRRMTEVWPGIEATPVFAMLLRCMRERRALNQEVDFVFPDGSRGWFDVRAQPVPEGIFVLSVDISERKETEARLIAADRMASIGTLAAGVAHEINNPLASVIANLALASEHLDRLAQQHTMPDELRDEIKDAREGAERVRMIVRDLRLFSRSEDVKLGSINVEQALESTLRMAGNEIRHRAKVVKSFANVPLVRANESRLGQVLLNLLVNAAQAIPEGNYQRNEIRVETRVVPGHRRVTVSVTDTGSGIPPEVQGRLFTPFFTTKPMGVGTGLGLSICHRIITTMGGTIEFSSEVGKGTTFRVMLPMAEANALVEAPLAEQAVAVKGRRGRVLVIDDDPAITALIVRILSSEHEVRAVHRASEAIDIITAGERFDVVLSDLMMPQVTGMDLYGALVALDRDQASRVVFMTGGAFSPEARAFLDETPGHRIDKPFEIRELRALVSEMLL